MKQKGPTHQDAAEQQLFITSQSGYNLHHLHQIRVSDKEMPAYIENQFLFMYLQ